MKDFVKKHPINKSNRKISSARLRAKRDLDQPLKLKHLFITAGIAVALLVAVKFILETDVENLLGQVGNPTVEFLYPTDLKKDSVLVQSGGIVIEQNCEYLLQIEAYGKRIYAQEQLGILLSLGLKSYVERTFSSSQPDKPLFKVMSGPYKTKSEVNNAREVMMKNNRQPLVISKCIKT